MQLSLLIFEGLGTSELILILVVALIIFGPKKLPQLARSFGKSMAEFKRASEDFKQQWEREVDLAETKEKLKNELSLVEAEDSYAEKTISRTTPFAALAGDVETTHPLDISAAEKSETITTDTIAPPEIKEVETTLVSATSMNETTPQKTSKRDWL